MYLNYFFVTVTTWAGVNRWKPTQNGQYFADDIFKFIFLKENCISMEISLKLVIPHGSIDINSALV